MAAENESRKLTPDTKWTLSAVAGALVAMMSVMQFQLNNLKEDTLRTIEAMKSRMDQNTKIIAQSQYTKENFAADIAPRDQFLGEVQEGVTKLRESRAKHREILKGMDAKFDRLVTLTLDNQKQASNVQSSVALVLEQTQRNATTVQTMLEAQQNAALDIRERLARLEAGRQLTPQP